MICNGPCIEKRKLHDLECTTKPFVIVTDSHEVNYQMSIIRSISIDIQLFLNINALMVFVLEKIKADRNFFSFF